jgi:hypothetical protein
MAIAALFMLEETPVRKEKSRPAPVLSLRENNPIETLIQNPPADGRYAEVVRL